MRHVEAPDLVQLHRLGRRLEVVAAQAVLHVDEDVLEPAVLDDEVLEARAVRVHAFAGPDRPTS